MKSIVRNFALSAAAAVSTANQPSFRFKKAHLLLALGLMAPFPSFAASPAPYCVAVNGGFGNGGTTFVARNFTLPAASKCSPWTGYTKTASTVVAITGGQPACPPITPADGQRYQRRSLVFRARHRRCRLHPDVPDRCHGTV